MPSFLSSCLPRNPSGSSSKGDPVKGCVFCSITPEKFDIVAENEQLIAFTDRSPAAKVHLLVIPRRHISSVKSLAKGDERLVEEMHSFGSKALDLYLSKNQPPQSEAISSGPFIYGSVADSSSSTTSSSRNLQSKESDLQGQAERRYGFHIPPFNSIDHLHLHSLLLPFKSSFRSLKYRVVKGDETRGYTKGWSWFVEWSQACRILQGGKQIKVGSC